MALNNCSNSGQGKHENKLTTRFPVSFQVKFKTVSTSYTVQAVSNDSLPVPIKRNHNCSSNRHAWLPDASEKSKPTFPNRQTKFTLTLTMPTHIPLSTNNLNTKFHCAFSAMTVTISLSALQYLHCQANHHASGFNLKVTSQCGHPSSPTVPAHYRTSGVQLLTSYHKKCGN